MIATVGDKKLATIPLGLLEQVVIQGACQVSPATVNACLSNGIPITYLNQHGTFLGRLEPHAPIVAELQRAQFKHSDCIDTRLALAKRFVTAKLHNCRTVLRRHEVEAETLDRLEHFRAGADAAENLNELRGYEGAAAAAYFRALGRLLGPDWNFERRIAHPPEGPFNSLLSFGYTLLYTLMTGAIRAASLNPFIGFFHADREGHATLASDLMEEWRPVLVDRFILDLALSRRLRPDDFEPTGPAGTCRFTREARGTFLAGWEHGLQEPITLPASEHPLAYQAAVLQQVLHFARHLREPSEHPYQPVLIR